MFSRIGCGVFLVIVFASAALAQMQEPRIKRLAPDWNGAARDLPSLTGADVAPLSWPALNAASATHFSGIANSAVPVLLPFDARAHLAQPPESISPLPENPMPAEEGVATKRALEKIEREKRLFAGLRPVFFQAGPSGYDAAFALGSDTLPALAGVRFSDAVLVVIMGSAVLYDLPPAIGQAATPVPTFEARFPRITRRLLEHNLRYSFEKYGVRYVVSITCFEGSARRRRISCKQADLVLQHTLQALQLAGGSPQAQTMRDPALPERPAETSPDFTYRPTGEILSGTGFTAAGGKPDTHVYAAIRFPLQSAPAYANSQSFLNWGDCDQTGRWPRPYLRNQAYRCRLNGRPLTFNEAAGANYAYPWRDNFCEHRHFYVGQCPGGLGHQGQDIRPAECKMKNEGADRCEAYQHDVVAAHDGTILREETQQSFWLMVNDPRARVRLRYMHMHPRKLNEDGVRSGRIVRAGEYLGKVGNYNNRENGTTYHLHLDLQVPTADGWVFVNPYMTLVSAYERLIGGRGTEVSEPERVLMPAEEAHYRWSRSPKSPPPRRGHAGKHAAAASAICGAADAARRGRKRARAARPPPIANAARPCAGLPKRAANGADRLSAGRWIAAMRADRLPA